MMMARSVEVGKKDEGNTFADAEEINIDIEDVNADNENHKQEVGLDDDGTMEVDTAKFYEAGAGKVEINSGEENVEYQKEVDNNADNRQEIKDGEAAVESFEVAPLWLC